jgi:hypothetical protein
MFRVSAPRPVLFLALGIFISLPLVAQVQVVRSRETSAPLKADGRSDDWPQLSSVQENRSGAEVAFQNDGRDLYILFIVKSPEAVEALESTGLTVLARHGGPKRNARGVLFLRREVSAESFIRWQEGQGTFMTEGERSEARKADRHDLLLTFAIGAGRSTYGPLRRLQTTEPPEFGTAAEAGGATYELKIPLASPDLVPGGIGAEPGELIRISFEWGGAQKKIIGTKATLENPPAARGATPGTVGTKGQEFLDTFDALSRPTMGTKRSAFEVDVWLAVHK